MDRVSTRFDREPLDVLVIGAGQAGLVMGWHLARLGLRFRIVDAGSEVGQTWRRRWDSLKLFTAAQYNGLPGMSFPAPHDTYPCKDDVAGFLHAYASKFQLPVVLNAKVTRLQRKTLYEIDTEQGPMSAHNVVVATGPFQTPFVPPLAREFDAGVVQLHSLEYRRPGGIPPGRVLVVGAANTGCQIALELTATHEVEISVGQHLPTLSQRPLGRDVWWWATLLGFTRITRASWLGRRLSKRDVIIGGGVPELERHGVVVRPRLIAVKSRLVAFADRTSSEYDTILWATGFRTDHSWIEVPDIKDVEGNVEHHRGVTCSAGLYFLGLTWQHTRTSALLGWVTRDAGFLADHINARFTSDQHQEKTP
ncbi:MAG: NAD(P)-binding domain-containing protein [Planctomycetes bacterium]|nr:NAD(P)-binding domain-containing protein [Planctomycetota bacterium]